MFKSNYERKMCYSIRKFSIGVASVAVASLVMEVWFMRQRTRELPKHPLLLIGK